MAKPFSGVSGGTRALTWGTQVAYPKPYPYRALVADAPIEPFIRDDSRREPVSVPVENAEGAPVGTA